MASAQVIDTGQSLGKNVTIQNGKVVPRRAIPTSSPRVLAATSPTEVASTDLVTTPTTIPQHMATSEPKTFFTTSNQEVQVYRDGSGSYWLSVSPVVSFALLGVLIGVSVFCALTMSAIKRKKARAKLRKLTQPSVDVEPITEEIQTEVQTPVNSDTPAYLEESELPHDAATSEKLPPKFKRISL